MMITLFTLHALTFSLVCWLFPFFKSPAAPSSNEEVKANLAFRGAVVVSCHA
jgi:hypothetical protein